jgi:uncharacterized membrane protein YraQ (UPF0718 family)/YHS domain-containing protein
MLFDTFWALVLGFTTSGIIQAFGSRQAIADRLGDHRPRTIIRAGLWGAVSSSCSYAASAIAKSLYDKGSDFTTSMVFMVASTNLVVDLGLVIWTLMGWRFAVAEIVGGVIMIVLLALVVPRVVRTTKTTAAPSAPTDDEPSTIYDAAAFTLGDLTMLRIELAVGFLVAGACAQLVPDAAWHFLFLVHHGLLGTVENAVIGPVIAALSFVCSVGNVPLANALWHQGLSFGGTLSFVYADLLTIPLLAIYFTFYGPRVTRRLALTFWFVMSTTGLLTEALFGTLGLLPHRSDHVITPNLHLSVVTTTLNALALVVLVAVIVIALQGRKRPASTRYAVDPICGMNVTIATASTTADIGGERYYFCCPGCRDAFVKRSAH